MLKNVPQKLTKQEQALQKGDIIWVKDVENTNYFPRVFSRFNSDWQVLTYVDGKSKGGLIAWDEWKELDIEENTDPNLNSERIL